MHAASPEAGSTDLRGLRLLRQLGAFSFCRWKTPHEHRSFNISEPRINERIRVPEVRLVGPNGEQVGIVRVEDALRLAQEADLDLVDTRMAEMVAEARQMLGLKERAVA